MDNKEFAKYMRGSIAPLFPDAVDEPGRCVLLKVDSGPGRMNLKLLATLKLIGIILYPCVPNINTGDGPVVRFLQDAVLEES